MDNQHRKITGYRELSQEEIDLMNRIKAHGEETAKLLDELRSLRENQYHDVCEGIVSSGVSLAQSAESIRCLSLAKDHLQTGQMWFVRAVALPQSF